MLTGEIRFWNRATGRRLVSRSRLLTRYHAGFQLGRPNACDRHLELRVEQGRDSGLGDGHTKTAGSVHHHAGRNTPTRRQPRWRGDSLGLRIIWPAQLSLGTADGSADRPAAPPSRKSVNRRIRSGRQIDRFRYRDAQQAGRRRWDRSTGRPIGSPLRRPATFWPLRSAATGPSFSPAAGTSGRTKGKLSSGTRPRALQSAPPCRMATMSPPLPSVPTANGS